jgi:predicted flavoprotein YhiN
MAADVLSDAGVAVTVYDRMPSVGRKFLMAGRGGLNLTHSEPLDLFLARYTASSDRIAGAISAFPPHAVRGFAHDLGQETFVGTSGRVFPKRFKASPLLRAWLARLRERHVTFETRQTLVDCDGHRPVLTDSRGATRIVETDATILALGGGSRRGAWRSRR